MRILTFLIALLLLVSCGPDSHHFKLEGHLLHLNQGDFYVYSIDGDIKGIDTIHVTGGRFAYEIPCERQMTLVMVFPNFSEHPIFAAPGVSLTIEGDAGHLSLMKVKGSKDNELMNSMRQQLANSSPQERRRYVEYFVGDHPGSVVGEYLVRRYLVACAQPDYAKALQLVRKMVPNQPDNGQLKRLESQLSSLVSASAGKKLPAFNVRDVYGRPVSDGRLTSAEWALVYTWSTFDYNSQSIAYQLKTWERQSDGRLKILGICLDPSAEACRDYLRNDSLNWPTVCDGEMFDGTLVRQFGLYTIGGNLLLHNGRIEGRDISTDELRKKIGNL